MTTSARGRSSRSRRPEQRGRRGRARGCGRAPRSCRPRHAPVTSATTLHARGGHARPAHADERARRDASARSARHRVAAVQVARGLARESMMRRGGLSGVIDAHHRDAGGVRPADERPPIEEEHAPALRPRARSRRPRPSRRAWPGRSPGCRSGSRGERATALTTTAPGPDSRAPRRIASSVPSMASTRHRDAAAHARPSGRCRAPASWRASASAAPDLRPTPASVGARAVSDAAAAAIDGEEAPLIEHLDAHARRASSPPSGRARRRRARPPASRRAAGVGALAPPRRPAASRTCRRSSAA